MTVTAIHMACGGGGITLGFVHAGVQTALAFDVDPICIETHRRNYPGDPAEVCDICEMQAGDLPVADVWTCGIPCESYSMAGRRLAERDPRDFSPEVARLLREACAAGVAPDYVFLENVPPYAGSVNAQVIRESLAGYAVLEAIFCYADYGVAQKRRRWHLIAARVPPVPIPEPTHSEQPTLFGQQPWLRFGAIRDGYGIGPMSATALRGIFRRLANNAARYGNAYQPTIVTDDDLLPTVMTNWNRGVSRSQVVLIYEEGRLRRVSLLEGRRAQGFPDSYLFAGTQEQQWGQIGRAVAPPFAAAAARAIVGSYSDSITSRQVPSELTNR
jgi:DNA (cytosine-5)-methyltransferase 1